MSAGSRTVVSSKCTSSLHRKRMVLRAFGAFAPATVCTASRETWEYEWPVAQKSHSPNAPSRLIERQTDAVGPRTQQQSSPPMQSSAHPRGDETQPARKMVEMRHAFYRLSGLDSQSRGLRSWSEAKEGGRWAGPARSCRAHNPPSPSDPPPLAPMGREACEGNGTSAW